MLSMAYFFRRMQKRDEMVMIKVLVNGALGKMGSTVARTVTEQKDMELVAAVNDHGAGTVISGGVVIESDLAAAIAAHKPDVVVDFTRPDVVMGCLRTVLNAGVNAVVGTTGFSQEDLDELKGLAEKNNVGCLICPNFAMGAVLMMKIAAEVAKYFPKAEIIELHHNNKLDAPSGTAIMTADKIDAARKEAGVQPDPDKTHESLDGARGASVDGIPIHSVRLPGYIAHQQVLFGGYGELLTIRHDSMDRKSFMPGVVLAVKKVSSRPGLTFGLENYL